MKKYKLLLVFMLLSGCGENSATLVEGVNIGNIATQIKGEDAEGKKLQLDAYKGKVVLLSFWASWCGPCKQLLPYEKQMLKTFKDQPFVLLGINSDIDKSALIKAQLQYDMTWPSLWDGTGAINREWNIAFLPMLILIDEKGIIRFNSKSIMDDISSFGDLAEKVELQIQKTLDRMEKK